MQQFRVSNLALQLSTAVAGALIALTIGIAGVTFVRVIALTAFGPVRIGGPAIDPDRAAVDRQWPYRLGVGVLVAGCLGAAAFAPLEVRLIGRGLSGIVGDVASGANAGPWVLQPVFAEFSALSPTWLWLVLPAMTVIVCLVAAIFAGRNPLRARTVVPWSSASPGVHRGVGYTSSGYANPVRNVLANVLLTRTELSESTSQSMDLDSSPLLYTYRVDVVDVVERYLYQPLIRALLTASRSAKKLQSGRLDVYMAYMLIVVLAVLAVVIGVS